LGLYISAHPLEKFGTYFSEQTVPLGELRLDMDGGRVTVGGIIMAARIIATKSGAKMAFVKIEDETSELEIIVFPKIFEVIGAKLLQDTVVKVVGKINTKDAGGNNSGEIKIIADEIVVVTEEELAGYQATGVKAKAPRQSFSGPRDTFRAEEAVAATPVRPKKIFVLVKDPTDHEALKKVKQACNVHPGLSEVILVLGDEKRPIRLPQKCDADSELIPKLVKIFGEDGVKTK